MMRCPASMCPLIAPHGSPWTGQFDAPCPGHDDIDNGGCEWWSLACRGNGIADSVETAARCGGCAAVAGPNQPRRHEIGPPRYFDCPKASVCRWQEQATLAGNDLCPPRDALARGIDPRVCLF
jgi:hypothetical protein